MRCAVVSFSMRSLEKTKKRAQIDNKSAYKRHLTLCKNLKKRRKSLFLAYTTHTHIMCYKLFDEKVKRPFGGVEYLSIELNVTETNGTKTGFLHTHGTQTRWTYCVIAVNFSHAYNRKINELAQRLYLAECYLLTQSASQHCVCM